MIGTSLMSTNPDIPEAHTLRGWYDQSGTETSFQAHTRTDGGAGSGGGFKRAELKTLAEIKALEIGDSPVYFSVQASLVHIKSENLAYPACATEGCNKKVVEDGKGWRCDKCNLVHPSPNYRYVTGSSCQDTFFSTFNLTGTLCRSLYQILRHRLGFKASMRLEKRCLVWMRTSC